VDAASLEALLRAALPEEALSAEELQATLFDDPDGVVLGDESGEGRGAVGVAVRGGVGWITVLVVDPAHRRAGVASLLLAAAHRWLAARGITVVRTGAAGPRYLWPGVDVDRHADAVSCFAALGYEPVGETHNHRCDVSFRSVAPDGVAVRRVVLGSADDDAVRAFAAASYPHWVDEVTRAVPHGCCHGAFMDGGSAVGFACHSVNRAGWIGPMATDPSMQGRGVGSALLGAVCRDLDLAELPEAEIAWVGPDAFYEKAAGTSVSRRFVILGRTL
jgi:GNAT superfamily N-acetyltransferase